MSDPYSLYQPPVQQFQSELPASQAQSTPKESSGIATFFKTIVKIILWIGAIILLIPVVVVGVCFIILLLGSILPLVGVGGFFFSGLTLAFRKKISGKFIPLLLGIMIFSFLVIGGQYDFQYANCPLHTQDYLVKLLIPLTQLFFSIIAFFGFFYNESVSFRKFYHGFR